MRHLCPVLCLAAILLVSGCADSKWSLLRHSQDTARLPPDKLPTPAQLVTSVNNNARQIQSLTCVDLDLDIKQGIVGNQFGIRGKLACQKPRNFLMRAEALGHTEADIGSNDQEFWFWIAKGEPYLFHCSYQDLAKGVRIPFPFQPEWVMEALGISEYEVEPTPAYVVQPKGRVIQLVQTTRNLQGQAVRKVTEFDPSTLRVTAHSIQNAAGQETCRAQITDFQVVRQGVVLPRKIAFFYPAEKLELKMTLGRRPTDVVLDQQFSPELFTRPTMSGVQSYDLARGPEGPNQINPAGGVLQR